MMCVHSRSLLLVQVALNRAKKMLTSAMMMNLESKMIVFEDIGRSVVHINDFDMPAPVLAVVLTLQADLGPGEEAVYRRTS